jgi:hypothetical protein
MVFQDCAILHTEIAVSGIMGNLESLGELFQLAYHFALIQVCSALDSDLCDMHYAKGAHFDPEKGCLPGTSKVIIDEITQWVNSPNGNNVPQIFS